MLHHVSRGLIADARTIAAYSTLHPLLVNRMHCRPTLHPCIHCSSSSSSPSSFPFPSQFPQIKPNYSRWPISSDPQWAADQATVHGGLDRLSLVYQGGAKAG